MDWRHRIVNRGLLEIGVGNGCMYLFPAFEVGGRWKYDFILVVVGVEFLRMIDNVKLTCGFRELQYPQDLSSSLSNKSIEEEVFTVQIKRYNPLERTQPFPRYITQPQGS